MRLFNSHAPGRTYQTGERRDLRHRGRRQLPELRGKKEAKARRKERKRQNTLKGPGAPPRKRAGQES